MWLVDTILDSTVAGALNTKKLRSLEVKYERYIFCSKTIWEKIA